MMSVLLRRFYSESNALTRKMIELVGQTKLEIENIIFVFVQLNSRCDHPLAVRCRRHHMSLDWFPHVKFSPLRCVTLNLKK